MKELPQPEFFPAVILQKRFLGEAGNKMAVFRASLFFCPFSGRRRTEEEIRRAGRRQSRAFAAGQIL
jgi:hypothetical protein